MLKRASQNPLCFHCGQTVQEGIRLYAEVAYTPQPMCCHGCKAAAETIVACGLDRFYRVRTADAPRPDDLVDTAIARFNAFDDVTLQRRFVIPLPDGHTEAALLLDGITCAACCWLIEQRLAALTGIDSVSVNYAARTAHVQWDPAQIAFSAILAAVAQLGYHATPYDAAVSDRQLAQERSTQLRRIGIAGLFGMQIMMLSLGLYLGADGGVDPGLAQLFRWASAVLVLPILMYSAQPFFHGAVRDARARALGMDVPVALGLSIAFAGSVYALLTGRGHVYFDSIAMFVFILLCGRFVELTVRRRAAAQWDRLQRIQPATATRISLDATGALREEIVPVTALRVGDRVQVRPGGTVPADGVIREGASSLNEALITGESNPITRESGDAVLGGSTNVESPLCIEVSRISADSRLAQIARLAQSAESARPAPDTLAGRVARQFIARLLLIALGVALFWWFRDASRWIPITVSVLVITCPCALALAAPAALAAATGTMLRMGLLVRRAHAVEMLGKATVFAFDKTGTLTQGELRLYRIDVAKGEHHDTTLALATALEAGSEHPVGRSLRLEAKANPMRADNIRNVPGEGVMGTICGREYFFGTVEFVQRMAGCPVLVSNDESIMDTAPTTKVTLAASGKWLATFLFCDAIRPGAVELIQDLHAYNLGVRLLSGDGRTAVDAVATELGIHPAEAALSPAQKTARLNQWRADGAIVCMVGDGVNDAPVLAAAQVSVAMGGGADLARAHADIVLVENRLDGLRTGIHVARQTRRIMFQNVVWSIAYNIVAVPLAAAGLVTPWMAALGMSLSSLLVVLNAARLSRMPGNTH